MKVLLVNPPRSPHNGILEHASEEARPLIHKKLIGPPLGLLTLAGALSDHDVTLLEMKGEYDLVPGAPPPRKLLRQYLRRVDPDVVGLTFIASEYPAGMELLQEVRRFNPEILTVAGGLHATLCPEHFHHPEVDVVCVGPGAHAFAQIVRQRQRIASLEQISGILLNSPEGLQPTAAPAIVRDPAGADFIPPDRSLLRRWISTYKVGQATTPSTYVFTSVGCPYQCTFCSIWPQYGGRFLQRDVESVIQELKTLDDYGVVRFADANTLVDLDWAEALFHRIAQEDIRKVFIMDIRVDTAAENPRLISKLARGGLKVVISGFESFRQEELGGYKKGIKPRMIEEAVKVFHQNGIMIRGNYVIPPDYGEEDFAALGQYAAAHSVALAGYTILTPMPGTAFYEQARHNIVEPDLARYTFFDRILQTRLPREQFYKAVSDLWLIRAGSETI